MPCDCRRRAERGEPSAVVVSARGGRVARLRDSATRLGYATQRRRRTPALNRDPNAPYRCVATREEHSQLGVKGINRSMVERAGIRE